MPTPSLSPCPRRPRPRSLAATLRLSGASRALSIRGACAGGAAACTIDAGGYFGAFLVSNGAALSLTGLSVANGRALQGGAIAAVGARTRVTATGVLFVNNSAW